MQIQNNVAQKPCKSRPVDWALGRARTVNPVNFDSNTQKAANYDIDVLIRSFNYSG